MNVGEAIHQARRKRKWSLSTLARESGISRGYLHLVEKGESSPTLDKVECLAALMPELWEYLLDLEDGEILILRLWRQQDYAELLRFIAQRLESKKPPA
ncbi:MAG: helix-turn-helix domain-containing protein [Anaerolineae bacterium]|nr:helix-turn-helix domain-containing protein [Anaerolineae bacterium]